MSPFESPILVSYSLSSDWVMSHMAIAACKKWLYNTNVALDIHVFASCFTSDYACTAHQIMLVPHGPYSACMVLTPAWSPHKTDMLIYVSPLIWDDWTSVMHCRCFHHTSIVHIHVTRDEDVGPWRGSVAHPPSLPLEPLFWRTSVVLVTKIASWNL